MSKVYSGGMVVPKGLSMASSEPVDQRSIVEYKADILLMGHVYPGLKVQVLEEIDGQILREYKFMGSDSSVEENWMDVTGLSGSVSITGDYLPLTGGTVTGAVTILDSANPLGYDFKVDTGITYISGSFIQSDGVARIKDSLIIGEDSDGGLTVNGTGSFTGVVSGINGTASNHFVTKAQLDSVASGGGSYLPLAGGTLTGTLIGVGALFTAAVVASNFITTT